MNGRILMADDDRVLVEVVRFNIEAAGYELTVTYDGAAGLAKAREEEFDLIISDYQMPKMNGHEFISGLREESLNQQTAVIFCSGKCYELDRDGLMEELNVSRIFMKPFSPSELVHAIGEVLADSAETVSPLAE